MALARAGRPSAADAHLGVGCRAWRTTRGRLFSFGNERAAALGVPRAGGPPGEGRGARRVKSRPSGSGDRCAMWHTSREDRYPLGRDAGTVARSAYARAPIEPCPAGSRPTWFGSMRQGVDNLAFGNDAGVAGVTPLRDFRPQRCKVGQLAIDFRDVDRSYLVGLGTGTARII